MKKLHLLSLAGLFVCAFALFSCSSDDDKVTPQDIKNNIVGTWQCIHINGYILDEKENAVKVDKDITGVNSDRITFRDNGTLLWLSSYSETKKDWSNKDEFDYTVNEDKIYLNVPNGKLETTLTVVSISDTRIVFNGFLQNDTNHPYQATFIKMKK